MTNLLGGDIHGELPEKTRVPLITRGESRRQYRQDRRARASDPNVSGPPRGDRQIPGALQSAVAGVASTERDSSPPQVRVDSDDGVPAPNTQGMPESIPRPLSTTRVYR